MPCMGPGPIDEKQVLLATAEIMEILQQKYGLMLMPSCYWMNVGEHEHKKVVKGLEKAVRDVLIMDNYESF